MHSNEPLRGRHMHGMLISSGLAVIAWGSWRWHTAFRPSAHLADQSKLTQRSLISTKLAVIAWGSWRWHSAFRPSAHLADQSKQTQGSLIGTKLAIIAWGSWRWHSAFRPSAHLADQSKQTQGSLINTKLAVIAWGSWRWHSAFRPSAHLADQSKLTQRSLISTKLAVIAWGSWRWHSAFRPLAHLADQSKLIQRSLTSTKLAVIAWGSWRWHSAFRPLAHLADQSKLTQGSLINTKLAVIAWGSRRWHSAFRPSAHLADQSKQTQRSLCSDTLAQAASARARSAPVLVGRQQQSALAIMHAFCRSICCLHCVSLCALPRLWLHSALPARCALRPLPTYTQRDNSEPRTALIQWGKYSTCFWSDACQTKVLQRMECNAGIRQVACAPYERSSRAAAIVRPCWPHRCIPAPCILLNSAACALDCQPPARCAAWSRLFLSSAPPGDLRSSGCCARLARSPP